MLGAGAAARVGSRLRRPATRGEIALRRLSRAEVAHRAVPVLVQRFGYFKTRSVGAQTLKRYAESERAFVVFAKSRQLKLTSLAKIDEAMEAHGNHLFFRGAGVVEYWYALYGYAFIHGLSTTGGAFLKSTRALKEWLKANPEYARDPCPHSTMALLAKSVKEHEVAPGLQAARCLALMFDGYLRLNEALAIKGADILVPAEDKKYASYALIVAPQVGAKAWDQANGSQRPSKCGQFDYTITFGELGSTKAGRTYGPLLLQVLKDIVVANGRVFRMLTGSSLEAMFRRAVERLQLEGLRLCPHSLRHGGPDAYRGSRSRCQIQKRGRWLAPSSVARYEKHGCLLRQVARLTAEQRRTWRIAANAMCSLLRLSDKPKDIVVGPGHAKRSRNN